MTVRRRRVETFEWTCECVRCAHRWKTLGDEAPTRCPKCKTRGFSKPARWERPDRRSSSKAKRK